MAISSRPAMSRWTARPRSVAPGGPMGPESLLLLQGGTMFASSKPAGPLPHGTLSLGGSFFFLGFLA